MTRYVLALALLSLALAGCGGSGEVIGGDPTKSDRANENKKDDSGVQETAAEKQTTTSVMATRRAARIQSELSTLADAFAPISASRSSVTVALMQYEQDELTPKQTVQKLAKTKNGIDTASAKVTSANIRTTVSAVQDSLMKTAAYRSKGIECFIDAIETSREIDECRKGNWNDSLRQARFSTSAAQEIRQTTGLNPGREDQFR